MREMKRRGGAACLEEKQTVPSDRTVNIIKAF